MAIKAQSSNQVTKITVKQSRQNLPIELGQSAQHFNNLSELWATSPNIVENKDYSSKYYAEKSKESAQNAQTYVERVNTVKNETITEITATKNEAIVSLLNTSNATKAEISQAEQTALTNIENSKNDAIDELIQNKSNALDDIESTSTKEQEELTKIKDEAIQAKDELINGGMFKFQLFDTKTTDRVLSYEETYGWALQGTYVYSTAVLGQRYGYPDFIERCKKEKNEATAKSVTLGSNTLTMYVHSNGHQFYDIADKSKVDAFYNTFGIADYYGIDETNERIFLPRNRYFQQLTVETSNVNSMIEAGLPNITGKFVTGCFTNGNATASGALYQTSPAGATSYGQSGTTNGLGLDASRSSNIYGKSSTVQPQSSLKLLYYCVGNTVSDTSWVDVVTQVQGGVKDLEDKKNLCIEEIESSANSYDNLTYRQITNCIKSAPNRIKYTLADGVLTILKGSVAVVPYGTEDLTSQFPVGSTFLHGNMKVYDTSWDGSKFFVLAELQANKQVSQSGTYELTVFMSANAGTIVSFSSGADASGDTIPTGAKDFYHTTLNTLKRYSNGAEQSGQFLSYPIMRISMVDSLVTDVRDVANCAGYIGKTIWADKGVEGLIADGRNEDRTYKNTEFTTPKVHILNNTTQTGEYYLGFDYYSFQRVAKKEYYYDFENNYNKHTNGVWTRAPFISCTITNGVVSNFEVVKPFRALDYNNKQEIISWSNPDYSAGVSISSGYTAPTDGWIGVCSASGCVHVSVNGKNITGGYFTSYDRGGGGVFKVGKNDVITFTNAQPSQAIFYPSKGAK